MSHPRRSRTTGPRARSRFRAQRRAALPLYRHTGGSPMTDTRKLSIRRGQVWTSLVRIAADARAEEYRARMMREADEHAKALALAVADEEICSCRFHVLTDAKKPGDVLGTDDVFVALHDLEDAEAEVNRLQTTAPKVPSPRPGAERFEAPLVRDKATARAMGNKYANAPAGTRAAHKRTPPPADSVARAERTAKREEVQRARRWLRRAGTDIRHAKVTVHKWGGIRVTFDRNVAVRLGRAVNVL